METLVVAVVLSAYVTVLTLAQVRERREWAAERSRLLDRIMARSYNELVRTTTTATLETPQMTSDEAEAKWALDHRYDDEAWHKQNMAEHPELYPDGE